MSIGDGQDPGATHLAGAPAVLSVVECAKLLGVSAGTVRRAIARGQIPTTRLGGRVIISRLSLERALFEQGEPADRPSRRLRVAR